MQVREIKFRSWSTYSEVMSEPFTLMEAFDYSGGRPENNIMQYTGLKDKNGVEIYEGDIVRVVNVDYSVTSKIIFAQSARFHAEGTLCDNLCEFLEDISGNNCSEVIGNIYENPELVPKLL